MSRCTSYQRLGCLTQIPNNILHLISPSSPSLRFRAFVGRFVPPSAFCSESRIWLGCSGEAEPNTFALTLLQFSASPSHPDGLIRQWGGFSIRALSPESPFRFLEFSFVRYLCGGFVHVVQPTPPRSQPHEFKSSFDPHPLLTYQLRLVPLYSLSSPFRQQWFFPSGERSLLASTPCISNTISDRLHPPTGKHPLLSLGSIRALCKCSQLKTPKCLFLGQCK